MAPPVREASQSTSNKRASRQRRHPLIALLLFGWRLLLAFAKLTLLAVLVAVAAGLWLYHTYSQDLPDPTQVRQHHPSETTRIYARDGETLLYELVDPQGGRRTVVTLDRIPPVLKDATISVEDAGFYEHPGFDLRGIVRAAWLNYQNQEIVSGGSTITQQLVRTILLPPIEPGTQLTTRQRYERKLRELILAFQVSQHYSKDQILSMYLNEVYYGAQAYGVEAAARTYFNKHVWELSDGEATLLAGLPQSPTVLNPYTNMEGARARQRITLGLMVQNGYLTERQAEDIANQPITLAAPKADIVAPHFVFYVRDMLEQRYGPDMLYRGGLRVVTSIDLHWQAEAQRIALQRINELRPRNAHNAAVVMLSPEGQILAMVGSIDYHNPVIDGEVNVALAPRQPGSALKPLVYAAALQQGWTPATVIWDTPTRYEYDDGRVYEPMNYDNSWHGPQRLRMALANSLNIPAVKTLEFVGVESFVNLASRMGISTLNDPARYGLSMALGSGEVRLLELTGAYNTFRNGGHRVPPTAVLRVTNNRGEVLERWNETQGPQVLGPQGEQIAYLITSILSDNQARWYMFGRGNVMELSDGRPAAVKTGTSNEWRDSWAIGYTTDVTVGVWVGNNDNVPMQEIAGANGAGLIWNDVMSAYHQERPPQPFPRPPYIVEQTICADTGALTSPACPRPVRELFIAGTEPAQPNVRYETVRVSSSGDCLAAGLIPSDQSRMVTFAVYPPEFRDWAIRNGIPQPPTEQCAAPAHSDTSLSSIEPLGSVQAGEQVFVHGTVGGAFRLEVGQGRDPPAWDLINYGNASIIATNSSEQPRLLGVWQTHDLPPGDYTLRLRVTLADGTTRDSTQVVRVR
jgi:1A family penicillin-binding protein